ncbi:MAG: hypothetical protein B6D61_04640 [Bacteroidetes bacterium 4484_249]|nr:MAG: hypothetical protein B6D61_04640 [Bacteroidetes bacterium 4484_249]
MLIKIFRSSYFLQYILFVVLSGILWLSGFITPIFDTTETNTFLAPAYSILFQFVISHSLISTTIAFILVLSGALFFNFTLTKNDIAPKNTLIPAMVFLLLMSHSPGLLYLHEALIPSVLLLIVIYFLFQVYTTEDAYPQVFNSGLLIGISSFFYFPSIYLLLFVWLTFIVFSLYKWREWTIVFFGFITPYVFLWTYYLWNDELNLAFNAYHDYFNSISFFIFSYSCSVLSYFISAIIILLFLWSFFQMTSSIQEKLINIRKKFWSVFWLFLTALFILIISGSTSNTQQVFLLIPFSVFIAYGFSRTTKLIWIELTVSILAILIIINNLTAIFYR